MPEILPEDEIRKMLNNLTYPRKLDISSSAIRAISVYLEILRENRNLPDDPQLVRDVAYAKALGVLSASSINALDRRRELLPADVLAGILQTCPIITNCYMIEHFRDGMNQFLNNKIDFS